MIQEGTWLPQNKLLAAQDITLEDFQCRAKSIIEGGRNLIMYQHAPGDPWGDTDWAETQAKDIFTQLQDVMISKSEYKEESPLVEPPTAARLLPRGNHYVVAMPVYNPEEVNSALVTYFQVLQSSFSIHLNVTELMLQYYILLTFTEVRLLQRHLELLQEFLFCVAY